MKTVLEQLMELQDKLDALKAETQSSEFTPCCNSECICGCDTEEQVTLIRGEVIEAPEDEDETDPHELAAQAQMVVFTRAELLEFATKLTERVVTAVKEAVTDTSLDADSLVTLELNTWNGNTIDIELDKDTIVESIHSEIDDAIDIDDDSIEDEITDILSEMYSELGS